MRILQFVTKVLRRYQLQSFEMDVPITYPSLDSVLETLNRPEFVDVPEVKNLLQIYNDEKKKGQVFLEQPKVNPLIVLEGLDGSGKTTVGTMLANEVLAEICGTPPDCLDDLRNYFNCDMQLRTAYYSLGNYIAAFQIAKRLRENPVIVDRYFHSTNAFALAEWVYEKSTERKLPISTDIAYIWPEDLLKPDIVFFLEVSENERIRRHGMRNTTNTEQEQQLAANDPFRLNVAAAYRNMNSPEIKFVNGDKSKKATVDMLYKEIQHLLH